MTTLFLYFYSLRYKDLCISRENEISSELYLSTWKFFFVGDVAIFLITVTQELRPIRSSTTKLSSEEMRTSKIKMKIKAKLCFHRSLEIFLSRQNCEISSIGPICFSAMV